MTSEYDFGPEIVKAQKCAAKGEWEGFKKIFEKAENRKKLLDPFDLFGNTAIHAVARSGKATLLRELLEMLNDEIDQRDALMKCNQEGNTLLHEAALFCKDMTTVDVIMDFGMKKLENGTQQLLELTNYINETPVFRAAKYGNLKMLKRIHTTYHHLEAKYFPCSERNIRLRPVLHNCLLTFNFGVAIWLVKKVDQRLSDEKDKIQIDGTSEIEQGFTCFQLLSKMPMAFRSTDSREMGITKKLVYYLLPNGGYESESELELDDAANNSFKSKRDTESGQLDDEIEKPSKSIFSSLNYSIWKLLAKVFSSLNYSIWKLLAKGCKCKYINQIWDQKKKHKFAMHLAKWLVKRTDPSCKYRYWKGDHLKGDQALCLIPDYPSNVTENKRKIELKKKLKEKKKIKEDLLEDKKADEVIKRERLWETPLFLAAASGIKEVVETIVDDFPEAISHVNDDGLNILHMAIKHRQLEIYEFIEERPAFGALVPRISNNGSTILHQAASMEYYREQVLPGVAYQLQDELEWYHRVRSNIPEYYLMHCDKDDLTAGDLLDIEHAEMHDQAKQWMKETAQSCSTVAVLIAGVVFAAAYAIPGGTEGGTPVLHKSSAFRIFTIMDVVALACSLGSVVMFLSILTSSFDLWDFHKSLPRKLKFGFILLFFALITTMLAFAATILLTIQMEGNNKKTTFIYSLAFVIVSLFGLSQFPLYRMGKDMFKPCSKYWKKKRSI